MSTNSLHAFHFAAGQPTNGCTAGPQVGWIVQPTTGLIKALVELIPLSDLGVLSYAELIARALTRALTPAPTRAHTQRYKR